MKLRRFGGFVAPRTWACRLRSTRWRSDIRQAAASHETTPKPCASIGWPPSRSMRPPRTIWLSCTLLAAECREMTPSRFGGFDLQQIRNIPLPSTRWAFDMAAGSV